MKTHSNLSVTFIWSSPNALNLNKSKVLSLVKGYLDYKNPNDVKFSDSKLLHCYFLSLQGGTQVSKLDKADILEMTVSHLRQIQQQQITVAMATNAAVVKQYNNGYSDCANETVRYMETSKTYPSDMIGRVRSHLNYSTAYAPTPDSHDSKLYVHGLSEATSPIRIEPQRMCKSASPRNEYVNYGQMYSTLLMPVPQVKYESLSDSETDYVNCDVKEQSQNDTLSLPVNVQVPVSVNNSPSQKQVWRPF